MGLDQTACSLIGRLMGQGNHTTAKTYYRILVFLASLIAVVNSAFLYWQQTFIIRLFNEDP